MFLLRKIRNGRVKLLGKWWRPDPRHIIYDGRCDGKVYAFGLYRNFEPNKYGSAKWAPYICLWGSEKAYRFRGDPDNDPNNEQDYPGDFAVDNSLPWEWWYQEGHKNLRVDCGNKIHRLYYRMDPRVSVTRARGSRNQRKFAQPIERTQRCLKHRG